MMDMITLLDKMALCWHCQHQYPIPTMKHSFALKTHETLAQRGWVWKVSSDCSEWKPQQWQQLHDLAWQCLTSFPGWPYMNSMSATING